jgi:hypothetical protein
MEFVPILALGTLVFTVVIFLKNLTAQQWRPAVTQLIAWLAGIVAMFVMAAMQFASGITVGSTTMDKLDFGSKVFVGLLAASLLSTLNEFKKALDRTDSAVVPEWFEPKADAAAQGHLHSPGHLLTPEEVEQARRQVRSTATPKT